MKAFLKFGNYIVLFLILLLAVICFYKTGVFNKYENVSIIKSDVDYDNDGVDDYTDILNGARELQESKPKYKSKYYDGGYPTDNYMVCTDILWYSLKNAGYDFKKLIDEDISKNKDLYDEDVGDQNIDFRRVKNIKVFLDRYAEVLDNDSNFNPGDIVIYDEHLAIVSDKVNKDGENYILHIHPFYNFEDDGLFRKKIIGHYRWKLDNLDSSEENDTTKINELRKSVLVMEADEAISSTIEYLFNNSYMGGKTFPLGEDTVTCVTIKELIDSGNFSGNYDGRVLVKRKDNSDTYLYLVDLSNGTLMIHEKGLNDEKNINEDIVLDDVVKYNSKIFQNTCPTDTSSLLSLFKSNS